MSILDVDLIGYETGDATRRRAIVDGVMRSLATGFVYVEHDLDEAELDECYAMLSTFFALSEEAKQRCAAPGSRGQRGYTGRLVETPADGSAPDWKEMLNWGEPAPPGSALNRRYPDRYAAPVLPEKDLPGISEILLHFHRRLAELQRRFLHIVSEGLGAAPSFFDTSVRHGATLSRAVYYPPMDQSSEGDPVWAGEHGDINLVTALPRATARGLQVKTASGWQDVAPPAGHAVLNSGMMLEHVSNGRLPTGRHRVVAGPNQSGPRLSVVQFLHPTPDTVLAPMPSCVSATSPARYESILAADWLDAVLREIGLAEGPG